MAKGSQVPRSVPAGSLISEPSPPSGSHPLETPPKGGSRGGGTTGGRGIGGGTEKTKAQQAGNLEVEQWRPIADFPHYEISDRGRVRTWAGYGGKRRRQPRIRRTGFDQHGFEVIDLTNAATRRRPRIRDLVLAAFPELADRPPSFAAVELVAAMRGDLKTAAGDAEAHGDRASWNLLVAARDELGRVLGRLAPTHEAAP